MSELIKTVERMRGLAESTDSPTTRAILNDAIAIITDTYSLVEEQPLTISAGQGAAIWFVTDGGTPNRPRQAYRLDYVEPGGGQLRDSPRDYEICEVLLERANRALGSKATT